MMDKPVQKVLLVDDEPWNLEVLESYLLGRGYWIIKAASGEDALRMVEESPPDLVLLDVMMPGMDGFEVCRRIKGGEKTRFIPVVMVTALDGSSDKIRAIEAGADDFISKPVYNTELLARTSTALRMKRYHDERDSAYSDIRQITLFFNDTIGRFDPMTFSLETAYESMFASILRRDEGDQTRPTHALVVPYTKSGFVKGALYFREGGAVSVRDMEFGDPRALAESFEERLCMEEAVVRAAGPVRNVVSCRVSGMLVACMNYGKPVGAYDAQVLKDLAMHAAFFDTIALQAKENDEAFMYTIKALARAAEANDEDTGDHIIRVNEYSYEVAAELGLPPELAAEIRYSAQMHDVGKIHVHPDILRKSGKLTPGQWEEMKKHTIYGPRILGGSPRLEVARQIALCHHERWDGSGYPAGLRGEEIPLVARVAAIGDVYDALRNKRVYKPPLDHETACRIILEGDGRTMPHHFDPRVLAIFKRIMSRFEEIYHVIKDDAFVGAA